ncbi:transposase IS4 [Nitzschia inconspicua]|uniref:Transposase IS4 n=1 Tax=Nitzschia inconspicua TaxID=303405 RepID=A0A9K3PAP6_9STRA|nr:transposase IS4 [Nitzschia inconspicua]
MVLNSAPLRYMRPLKVIQTKHPQIVGTPRIEQLLALRKELKRLNKRLQFFIVFRHDDFPNGEIYCHERFCRVEVGSPPGQLFGDIEADEDVEVVEEVEPTDEIPAEVQPHSVGVDDRFLLRNDGFNVDDDRDPALENIPVPGETVNDQQTWGWGGRCHRNVFGATDDMPKLNQLTDSESKLVTILSLFLCLFPATYLDEVLLAEINRNLDKEKARRIGLGEFLRFLGLWYYMATFKSVTRAQFWSTKDNDPYRGALIRFHGMMSMQRFDLILKSLRYTNRLATAYKDKFHGIRQLIEAATSCGDAATRYR